MSSSMDSGYHADEALNEKRKPCPKGGKHKWEKKGSWPSEWETCKKCGRNIYWK